MPEVSISLSMKKTQRVTETSTIFIILDLPMVLPTIFLSLVCIPIWTVREGDTGFQSTDMDMSDAILTLPLDSVEVDHVYQQIST